MTLQCTVIKQEALLMGTSMCLMPKLKAKQRTFQSRGSNVWNNLPSEVQNTNSLNLFKSKCSAFIAQH